VIEALKADITLPLEESENRKDLAFVLGMNGQVQIIREFLWKPFPGVQNAIPDFRFVQQTKQSTQKIRKTAVCLTSARPSSNLSAIAVFIHLGRKNSLVGFGHRSRGSSSRNAR
jgi:hypothetical protein